MLRYSTTYLSRLFVVLVVSSWLHPLLAVAEGGRPNFVFIIADDISPHDLACYGPSPVQTPNLDRLAAEGEVFDRAYLTTSSCSPTRCSIITGRYPHNTAAPELHMPLPAGQFMFPQALREAGYFTASRGRTIWGPRLTRPSTSSPLVRGLARSGTGCSDCASDRKTSHSSCGSPRLTPIAHDWQTTEDPLYDPAEVVVPPFLIDGPLTRGPRRLLPRDQSA